MSVKQSSILTAIAVLGFQAGLTNATVTVNSVTFEIEDTIPTLTISGSGFGSKPQAPPILWDFGEDIRENGVPFSRNQLPPIGETVQVGLGSGESIWSVGIPPFYSAETRYTGIARSYHSRRNGWLGWPYANGGLDTHPASKAYISWRLKTKGPIYRYVAVGIDETDDTISRISSSGAFKSRLSTMVLADGKEFKIKSISIDRENNSITLDNSSNLLGKESFEGAKLISHDNTEIIQLSSSKLYRIPVGSKYLRSWEGTQGVHVTMTLNRFYGTIHDDKNKEADRKFEKADGSDAGYGIPDISQNKNWNLLEVYIDLSGDKGKGVSRFNTQDEKWFYGLDLTWKPSDHGPTISNIGFDAAGGTSTVDTELYFGEIYFDNTPQRVVISSAKNISQMTDNIEFQYPLEWSPGRIKVQFREGALNKNIPLYLYIYNEQNQSNEIGYCIKNCNSILPAKSSAPGLIVR